VYEQSAFGTWYQDFATDEIATVQDFAETEDTIFYAKDGIWGYQKATGKTKQIVAGKNAKDFCVLDGFLYYLSPFDGKKTEVLRVSIAGGNTVSVWNTSMSKDIEPHITNLKEFDHMLLCSDSGTSCFLIEPLTGKIFRLLDDYDSMSVANEHVYYIDHAEKTFSVFRKSIKNPDALPVLIAGDGKAKNNQQTATDILFDGIVAIDRNVYASQRFPAGIWQIDPSGNRKKLLDFSGENVEMLRIFADESALYFIPSNQDTTLYRFDPKTKEKKFLQDNPLFKSSRITIAHGRVILLQ
jgi:hypothetical protein